MQLFQKLSIVLIGTTCIFVIFTNSSCAPRKKLNPTKPSEEAVGITEPAKQALPPGTSDKITEIEQVCPTADDVLTSISGFNRLVREAQSILDHKKEDVQSIDSLQKNLQDWDYDNQKLIDDSVRLLGADGTAVFPEIPLALKNLRLAGDWLNKSLEETKTERTRDARTYIKGARAASTRASKVIEGEIAPNPRFALLKTPKYIRRLELAYKKPHKHLAH